MESHLYFLATLFLWLLHRRPQAFRRIAVAVAGRGLLLIFVSLTMGAAAMRGAEPPRVLILFSNDRLLPANQRLDEGIRRALDPEGNQSAVSFFAEFLDATRIIGPEREAMMEQYLKDRFRDLPPQVVIALGPQALGFLVARHDRLFKGTPIVFGGTSQGSLAPFRDVPGITGLPMDLTVIPSIEALLAMRPQTREIVIVHGASPPDRAWGEGALQQAAPFASRVKITAGPVLPLPELKAHLAALPRDAAVVYLSYFQGPTGETYTPARVARELAGAASVPVVAPYDTYIGTGVLGGSVSPFEEEGFGVGLLVRRLLAGEKAENIGFLPPNTPRVIVDERAMQRWNIKSVPPGTEIRYHVPTLWEAHRTAVIGTSLVLALQSLLIAGLVVARARRRRAEKELRFSEARFAGVFRGSPAAISIVRQSDGRILDVNPGWEKATGVSRTAAIGRTPLETGMVIDGDADVRFRQFLDSGKLLHDYEQVIRTPDGRTRWLTLSTELITLHDEPCYVLVAKDVTEQREAEEARRQLAQTSRLALLGEITASIAHEINQPLGASLSNTDAAAILMRQASPPLDEVRQILADIRRDNLRASDAIHRVRALIGRREVRHVPVDLNTVLRDTLKLVAHDARRRGVTLHHELAGDLPVIHADAAQLEQVLLNLLLNAMDAMKDTPVAARLVTVRSSRKDDESVEAVVEDRGHGIPPDKLGRIFDSFYTTKEGGMGLGLALARSMAETHGGDLYATNNPSGGATFHLILPVNPPVSDDHAKA